MPTDTSKTAAVSQQASKQSTKSKKSNQPSNKANGASKKPSSKKKVKVTAAAKQAGDKAQGARRKRWSYCARVREEGAAFSYDQPRRRINRAVYQGERLFNHVLEECIEEAGESGLIQPVQGTVNDPEGATAESLGLVNVRDLRASKTFTELIRVIAQAMATKEYQRAKVLMQLMGKKTLGMDVVHAIRFLANSNNCHATSHLVQRSEADMLEMIIEDAQTNYDLPDDQLCQIKRSFGLVGHEINEHGEAEEAVKTARDAELIQTEENDDEE